MNFASLLAIARHELRLTRRLVRYWVFAVLSPLAFALLFAYYGFLHGVFSRHSGSVAWLNPRYLIGAFGFWAVALMFAGTVFLAFDVRARDVRSRIAEVLDVRPFRNLELVAGRALGMLVAALVPIVIVVLLADVVGAFFGETLEPRSMLALLLLVVVPALWLAIAATMLVTLLVRSRLLAAVLVLGGLVGSVVLLLRLPMPYAPWCDLTGLSLASLPSDLAPVFTNRYQLVQRIAVTGLGCGLLVLSAAVFPRRDGVRRATVATGGVVIVLVAVGIVAAGIASHRAGLAQTARWAERHELRSGEPVADLVKVEGSVEIDPGRALVAELDLTLAAPEDTGLDRLLLTLNPGFAVTAAALDGRPVEFDASDGLLEIPADLPAGRTATLSLAYRGRPDPRFAYIDQAQHPQDESFQDLQSRLILGTDAVLFSRRFVALMPGIAWLPRPGTFSSGDDPARRPRDPFGVVLTVGVPAGFLVGGPGRADEVRGDGPERRFRFDPGAPVTDVALVAAPYVSRALEVDDVRFELLVSPAHVDGIDRFAPAKEALVALLRERLEELRSVGLDYPYGGLTVAEIPIRLRGYGGGWRMDTTLAQPGLVLMRESGLPTAAFDRWLEGSTMAELDEEERGRRILRGLRVFFRGDMLGGNLLVAASRDPAWYQVAAAGPDALPLDFLVETLSAEIVAEEPGFFSSYIFDRNLQQRIQSTIVGSVVGGTGKPPSELLAHDVLHRAEVWERIEKTALAELSPDDDPRTTLAALQLKGRAMARTLAMRDGREGVGRVLGELVSAHRGQRYGRDDLVAAAQQVGYAWDEVLADWIDETSLPAFVAGPVRVLPVTAEAGARAQQQVLVPVRNEGTAAGFVVVRVLLAPEENEKEDEQPAGRRRPEARTSDPVRIPAGEAREIGLVVPGPPLRVMIEPLLALNREPFAAPLEPATEDTVPLEASFVGARVSDWAPADRGIVVFDDLGPGFEVEEAKPEGWLAWLRGGGRRLPESELDHGLPVLGLVDSAAANRWARVEAPGAWGRYRHTVAVAMPAGPGTAAVFGGELEREGMFRLEVHVPPVEQLPLPLRGAGRGTWSLAVIEPEGGPSFSFDAQDAGPGWHDLGRLSLGRGTVRIRLSNPGTSRRLLLADALRLVPVRSGGAPEEVREP